MRKRTAINSTIYVNHTDNSNKGSLRNEFYRALDGFSFYKMTKDGFVFLVMGFTGKAASQIKEAYINAFNWMAE